MDPNINYKTGLIYYFDGSPAKEKKGYVFIYETMIFRPFFPN